MKARSAARLIALLTLFANETVFFTEQDTPELTQKRQALLDPNQFDRSILEAIRALCDEAQQTIVGHVQVWQRIHQQWTDAEYETQENLEAPIGAPVKPITLPNSRELRQDVEHLLIGAEELLTALWLPELLAHGYSPQVQGHALRLLEQFYPHREAINTAIQDASTDWRLDRLMKMDRCVLRLAVAELLFCSDVDSAISIDEAIELAKQFSTEDSYKYINGVLGAVFSAYPPQQRTSTHVASTKPDELASAYFATPT